MNRVTDASFAKILFRDAVEEYPKHKWHEEHDEHHQINIESLQLHQVVLTPHAHKVQLMWIFTDPVGTERTLRGLLNTPRKLAVSGEIMATWPDDEFTVYF